jgi:hypothetical protein
LFSPWFCWIWLSFEEAKCSRFWISLSDIWENLFLLRRLSETPADLESSSPSSLRLSRISMDCFMFSIILSGSTS